MQRIAFTGTHGTGKSTTAIALNKVMRDHLYMPSFAGSVARRMGFDLNKPQSPQDLLNYQERVLDTFIESYKATQHVPTIYDRSPNDIAAYTYIGLKDEPEYRCKAEAFVTKCLAATEEYCDVLIYPEADLSVDMETKFNRPVGDKYNRINFDKVIDHYASRVSDKVRVIDIPLGYQYDDRVKYILKVL